MPVRAKTRVTACPALHIVRVSPNGWRLSGQRSAAERVRCSRGFGVIRLSGAVEKEGRVPFRVEARHHRNLALSDDVKDAVRKTMYQGTSYIPVHGCVLERPLHHSRENALNLIEEGPP